MSQGELANGAQFEELRGEAMRTPDEVAAMLRFCKLGWGSKRIASALGCSRNTVKRYLESGEWRAYRRERGVRKLDGLDGWRRSSEGTEATPTWCARIWSESTA